MIQSTVKSEISSIPSSPSQNDSQVFKNEKRNGSSEDVIKYQRRPKKNCYTLSSTTKTANS